MIFFARGIFGGGVLPVQEINETPQNDSLDLKAKDDRGGSADLRSSPRRKCNFKLSMALMRDTSVLPLAYEFFEAECRDISCGGISFYIKQMPDCKDFVIVLGQKPNATLVVAHLVHAQEVTHNDQQMYMMGCKFVNRLND